jgi:hypothetical protein
VQKFFLGKRCLILKQSIENSFKFCHVTNLGLSLKKYHKKMGVFAITLKDIHVVQFYVFLYRIVQKL